MQFNWRKWSKNSVVVILLLCSFAGFAQSNPEHWDASYYTGYSVQTFKQLSAVHKKIAGSKFNHRLLDAAVFFRTNEERIKNNLPQFNFSIALEKAALGHSIDMVQHNFYAHDSPVPGSQNMTDRLKRVGVDYTTCAENIYNIFDEDPTYWSLASKLVEGWMNSSGHRRNILNPNLKYLGCGTWPYNNPEWPTYMWFKSTQSFSDKDAR
ncbi:MAG: hypothetical protein RJA53_1066 [Bacteroidota bacterium]|jgi:uncharacterized protein YkwD